MDPNMRSLDTLNDIKRIMEKSSRFISLSGWSGIAAGICGMAGAYFAHVVLDNFHDKAVMDVSARESLKWTLTVLAAIIFSLAFSTAFIFTYFRSRQDGIAIWGQAAKRLLWNTMLPMIAGGMFILRLLYAGNYSLIAPSALMFYGLALVNGGKYTLGEIRYLGYLEIMLAIINLWFPDQWLLLCALGFGLLHIIYGIVMWWKYERNAKMMTA